MIFGVEVEHGRTTALRAQAVPHQFKPDLLRPGRPGRVPLPPLFPMKSLAAMGFKRDFV